MLAVTMPCPIQFQMAYLKGLFLIHILCYTTVMYDIYVSLSLYDFDRQAMLKRKNVQKIIPLEDMINTLECDKKY